MTTEIDRAGFEFADMCQSEGLAGFAIRTTETGDVRLICLQLPASLIVGMLRAAADVYEANAVPETVN